MKRLMIGLAVALGAVSLGAAPVLPYGTYLVKGAFLGDYNTVLRDAGDAKVRVQRSNGTVIAETSVASPNSEGFNFVLEIPVASASTAKACAVGEMLDCSLITKEEGTMTVPACLKVASPTVVGNIAYNCVQTKTFTDPKDGSTVEVPIAYIMEAESWMNPGETYDPWADYDGDGVSNYEEYKSGTNPFDESDRLRIRKFSPDGGQFAIAFENVGGHVYAISSANTLERPDWMQRRVRTEKTAAEQDQVYAGNEDGEPGMTRIFITPVAGAKQEFFKVEAR